MAYTRQTWNAGPSGATPVTATRLNYMETGIYNAAARADTAYTQATAANTSLSNLSSAVEDLQEGYHNLAQQVVPDVLVNAGALSNSGTGWHTGLNMDFHPAMASLGIDGQGVQLYDTTGGTHNSKSCWRPKQSGVYLITMGWDSTSANTTAGGIRFCVQEGTSTSSFSTVGIASGYNGTDGLGMCGSVAFTLVCQSSRYYRPYWRFACGGFTGNDGTVAGNRPGITIGVHLLQGVS